MKLELLQAFRERSQGQFEEAFARISSPLLRDILLNVREILKEKFLDKLKEKAQREFEVLLDNPALNGEGLPETFEYGDLIQQTIFHHQAEGIHLDDRQNSPLYLYLLYIYYQRLVDFEQERLRIGEKAFTWIRD